MLVVLILLCASIAFAAPDDAPVLSPLARSCLAEFPPIHPEGCVGASMAISPFHGIISALAASDDTTGMAHVFHEMEIYVDQTPTEARPYLASVLVGCAGVDLRMGRLDDCHRRLVKSHGLLMGIHERVVAFVDEGIERLVEGVYPEDGCIMGVGGGTCTLMVPEWIEAAEGLKERGVSDARLADLDAGLKDIEPLVSYYADLNEVIAAMAGSE